MKVRDIEKASAATLEWERTCEVNEQRRLIEGSPCWKRQTTRIARLDRQIAATAKRHLVHLREQMQKHIGLGNTAAAINYATRIQQVEAMATDAAIEHREVEVQTEAILRRAA